MFRQLNRLLTPVANMAIRKEQLHLGEALTNQFAIYDGPGYHKFSTAAAPAANTPNPLEEYQINYSDPSDQWQQLTKMFNDQRWTSNDHATLALFPKMDKEDKSIMAGFITRKADNKCMGGIVMIEQKDFCYGNAFIIDAEVRGTGLGLILTMDLFKHYFKRLSSKPFILRGAPHMFPIYGKKPLNCVPLYLLLATEFKDKNDLLTFFPKPETNADVSFVTVRDMTPEQYEKFVAYDLAVTGTDRKVFLKDYYDFPTTIGLAMFDKSGEIQGLVGIVPTSSEKGLYKLNPLYAKNQEDACRLVHAITERIDDPDAHFVTHFRTGSAGEWISNKAQAQKRPIKTVGGTLNATHAGFTYTERAKLNVMFAPTNSPAHFDG